MRATVIILMSLTAVFAACRQTRVQKEPGSVVKVPSGQWILESYNSEHGYVLRKDGTRYTATCSYYYTAPILENEQHPGEPKLSVTPRGGFAVERNDSGECTAILAYIHKAVPFQQYSSYPPDRLFFLKQESAGSYIEGITEFTIIQAE